MLNFIFFGKKVSRLQSTIGRGGGVVLFLRWGGNGGGEILQGEICIRVNKDAVKACIVYILNV